MVGLTVLALWSLGQNLVFVPEAGPTVTVLVEPVVRRVSAPRTPPR